MHTIEVYHVEWYIMGKGLTYGRNTYASDHFDYYGPWFFDEVEVLLSDWQGESVCLVVI